LIEPHLRDIQRQQYRRQCGEHPQLTDEVRQILARHCVVKRLIPGIESDLHVRRCGDDDEDPRSQHQQAFALG